MHTTTNRRSKNAALALSAKIQRAARHEAMMARHAEHRAEVAKHNEAIEIYEAAFARWQASGKGPMPVHPDAVTSIVGKYDDDDLLRAANELGIDLSEVGA